MVNREVVYFGLGILGITGISLVSPMISSTFMWLLGFTTQELLNIYTIGILGGFSAVILGAIDPSPRQKGC